MCDFKPGDDAICVFAGPWWDFGTDAECPGPALGAVCRVAGLGIVRDLPVLYLDGWGQDGWQDGWQADCFRKAPRRDLSAWLETAVDVPALDKSRPAPAKKRERV